MHIVLHLTTGCNMSCEYCYSPQSERNDMTDEIAFRSIDFIAEKYPINTGIIFFGGEPLLKKELIKSTISYCKTIEKQTGAYFHYKLTTNGILLDKVFLEFANSVNLNISMSIDGIEESHNRFRRLTNNEPTFEFLQDKIDLLLKYQPYSKVLMTVSPETLPYYAESFDYLINRGFKYMIASLNYAGNWKDSDLRILKTQYQKISQIYERFTKEERKFYFSPFEMKFASHIRQNNLECYQCHLAKRQISIAHDGIIYPCVQFVKDGISNRVYGIGNIWDGINIQKQEQIYKESKIQSNLCPECDYNDRCNNKCSCLNWQLTGQINKISPVICETERVLIPIVDALGKRLYKQKLPMFIQKHYNAVYPIISMLEDFY